MAYSDVYFYGKEQRPLSLERAAQSALVRVSSNGYCDRTVADWNPMTNDGGKNKFH